MKAEELAATLTFAEYGDRHAQERAIKQALRSYGLACAMAERERCAERALSLKVESDIYLSSAHNFACFDVAFAIRSRPTGDELMKEIDE